MFVMAFKGWPVEAVEFYEDLEADNSKTFWQEHKSVYERSVKGPTEELLAELGRRLRRRPRLPALPRPPLQQGQDSVQAELCRPPAGRLHLVLSRRALHWQRPLHTRARPAPAFPRRRRQREVRIGSGVDRRDAAQRRLRRRRTRPPHDGSQGLPEGPPPDRAAEAQGHRYVQILAGRRVDRHEKGQGPVVACLDAARPLNAWLERYVG
jgi:hypothetical protein